MRKAAHRHKAYRKVKISRVKLGVIVLAVLISLIAVGKLLGFIFQLNQPFSPDSPTITRSYQLGNQSLVNIIIKSESVYVLSLDVPGKKILTLKIPDDAYVPVPFSFGRWKMSSVYGLGQAEDPPMGAALLKDTATNLLGIPVEAYFILGEKPEDFDIEKILESLRGNPISALLFLKQARTDLSPRELWWLLWEIRGVRFDKIKNLDLEGNLAKDKIDQLIQQNFVDMGLRNESLGIGIYNATDHPGLAEKAARIIANMGGRVIFTSNLEKHLDQSLVLDKGSYAAKTASQIFAPFCQKKGSDCSENKFGLDLKRADVNIFLGEDYFLRYNTK